MASNILKLILISFSCVVILSRCNPKRETVNLTGIVKDTTVQKNGMLYFDLLVKDRKLNYNQIKDKFNVFWDSKSQLEKEQNAREKKMFDAWDNFWAPRVAGLNGSFDSINQIMGAYYANNIPQNAETESARLIASNTIPNWTPLGPFKIPANNTTSTNLKGVGRVTKVKFHTNYDGTFGFGVTPQVALDGHNTIFAGTRFGGLWRSDNGGANWYNPSRFLLPYGVQDIELFGRNRIYIISTINGLNDENHGFSCLQRSEDGGATWFISGAPFGYNNNSSSLGMHQSVHMNDILVHPRCWYVAARNNERSEAMRIPTCNTSRVFAASSLGVHYTEDNCITWTRVFNANTAEYTNGPSEIVLNHKQSNELYLTGQVSWNDMVNNKNANVIYRTLNEGDNWYAWQNCRLEDNSSSGFDLGFPTGNLPNARIMKTKLMPSKLNKDKMYAVVYGYYMGSTNYNQNGISFSPSNPGRQWLFVTNNRGLTWTTLMAGTSAFNRTVDFEIDPLNDNVIHFADCGGYVNTAVYYRLSISAGNTVSIYQQANSGSGMHADVRDLETRYVYNGAPSVRILAGTDGGVNLANNAYANPQVWSNVTGLGLNISEMYSFSNTQTASADVLVSGLQDNGSFTLNVDNPAIGWQFVVAGDGMSCKYTPFDQNRFYSSDGQSAMGQPIYQYNAMNVTSPQLSQNTTGMGLGEWVYPIELNAANPNEIYVGKTNLWKTLGSINNTWTALMSQQDKNIWLPNGNSIYSFKVADNNNIVAYTRWGKRFYTQNAGATWTELKDPSNVLNMWGFSKFAYNPASPRTLFITISGYLRNSTTNNSLQKVYKVTNLGQANETWTNWSNGLSIINQINCIAYDGTSNKVYVGTDHGVYVSDALANPNFTLYGSKLPITYVTEIDFRHNKNKLRISTFGRGVWEIDK